MEYCLLETHGITLKEDKKICQVKDFLAQYDLQLDEDVEYIMAFFDGERMVATGSFSGRVLKCIAVDKRYQGLGIANKVISHLVNEEYLRGNTHLFIYTKPNYYHIFHDLGFYKISEVPSQVVLLENCPSGIKNYVEELEKQRVEGKRISSIVMNCNPFTLGHQYLIERASQESDVLHIFIVWEERSSFPAEMRYHLAKEGTKHLSNVVVHRGKDYIISSATFPSYFMKSREDIVKIHALLDLEIYGSFIAPALGVTKRFIGEEPYCPVTKVYNRIMKEMLPKHGIEVVEIPRLSKEGYGISASLVRKYLGEGNIHKTKDLVPETTYKFLLSQGTEDIIQRIRNEYGRHS